jgi:hypothetical protein
MRFCIGGGSISGIGCARAQRMFVAGRRAPQTREPADKDEVEKLSQRALPPDCPAASRIMPYLLDYMANGKA